MGDEDGPALLRRLAATVAEGRMLDAGQLAELNELLARTPVTARVIHCGGHPTEGGPWRRHGRHVVTRCSSRSQE